MKVGKIKLGAEFIEVNCDLKSCHPRDGMPKLVFLKHNGYGTGKWPPRKDFVDAKRAIREHGHLDFLKVWIGKG